MSNQAAVDVAVKIALQDTASDGLERFAAKQQKVMAGTEKFALASNERQQTAFDRLAMAREKIGIRSEKAIQEQIKGTERAYRMLAESGKLSAEEQARALDKTREHVTRLTNEMGKLTAEQTKQANLAKNQERGRGVLTAGGALVAGAAAASYVLRPKIETAMQYDYALAHMSNTAFNDRDVAGRRIGMTQLEDAITKARKEGGGTRESGAEALDAMIASGTVSAKDAMSMLPSIMKASTASNTSSTDIANIAIRAQQNMKIKAEDLPNILNMAMAAGQAGGFELKDMAKWLPQQMAMAKLSGISGKDGIKKLLAWNQASVITAGTKDEAGNNLRDLLMEVNTPHFQAQMAKSYLNGGHQLKKGQKESKIKSVNDVFLDYQSQGINKVEATVDMVDKVVSKNKEYQALQAKLKAIDPKDKESQSQIIEAMAAQVKGTEVGKIFHNQQSLMAVLAIMNSPEYIKSLEIGAIAKNDVNSGGAVDGAQDLLKGTGSYNQQQRQEAIKNAEKKALDGTGYGASLNKSIGELADNFPKLTGSLTLATAGATALAGAAMLAAGALGFKGSGGVFGKIGDAAGAVLPAAAKWLPRVAKGATVAGVASVAGEYALGKAFGEQSAVTRYGTAISTGAGLGAMAGAPFAGVGAIPGAIGGGLLGMAWELGNDFKAMFNKTAEAEKPKMDATVNIKVSDDRVSVSQTQVTSQNVNTQVNVGNVLSGAPL
jgi:hypothetical protein